MPRSTRVSLECARSRERGKGKGLAGLPDHVRQVRHPESMPDPSQVSLGVNGIIVTMHESSDASTASSIPYIYNSVV